MKNRILLSTILLSLMVSGCKGKEENSSSSLKPSIDNTSTVVNSTSSSYSEVILPAAAVDFILFVNEIVIDEYAGIAIEEAWEMYEALGDDWNYPQVSEAYYKLIHLEEMYNEYIELYYEALEFIEIVEEIPYLLTLEDERYIVEAESKYENLSDDAKEILGVDEAYQRLIKAREDFDNLYRQSIIDQRQEIIDEFLDIVSKLPNVDEMSLDDIDDLNLAFNAYENLADDIKEENLVIDAYNKLIELQAKYEDLLNVRITLELDGGTCEESYIDMVAFDAIGTLPTPTKDNHRFVGWFTELEGGDQVTSTTIFDKDSIIYARWVEIVDVKITFNANGGECSETHRDITNEVAIGELPIPTLEGYRFLGWYTSLDGDEPVTSSTIFEESTTIYAHWEDENIVHNIELTNAYLDTYMNNHLRVLWDKSVLGNVSNSLAFKVVINYNGVDYKARVIDWLRDWGNGGAFTGIGVFKENCPADLQKDEYTITVSYDNGNGIIYNCSLHHSAV